MTRAPGKITKWGRCAKPCGLRDSYSTHGGAMRRFFSIDHYCILGEGHPGSCEFIAICRRSGGGICKARLK